MTSSNDRQGHKRVMLDLDRCISCRTCAAACFYHHNDIPIIAFGVGPSIALPVVCRQCIAPGCVDACPNGAMTRDADGVVSRSPVRCTGCMNCVVACPFGVLSTDHAQLLPKCDLCPERTIEGLDPWCVASCSGKALRFLYPHDVESHGLILLGGRITGHGPLRRSNRP